MKKKRTILIVAFLGSVFQGSGTEYLKHKLDKAKEPIQVEKPAPKKVSYIVKFTWEVE